MIQRDIIVRTSSARFTTSYQALNCEDVTCIDVTIFLLFQEFTDFCPANSLYIKMADYSEGAASPCANPSYLYLNGDAYLESLEAAK